MPTAGLSKAASNTEAPGTRSEGPNTDIIDLKPQVWKRKEAAFAGSDRSDQ